MRTRLTTCCSVGHILTSYCSYPITHHSTGNIAGSLSWFGIVFLRGSPEVDIARFIPLIALKACVCSILGVVVLGDPLGPLGTIGFIIGVGGIILIAYGKGPSDTSRGDAAIENESSNDDTASPTC